MRKVILLLAIPALLLAPSVALVVATVFAATRTGAACGPAVGNIPNELIARTTDGVPVHLDRTQLTHAATIIGVGGRTAGITRDGVVVALMAALTESRLLMLANATAHPESAALPNDGDGGDHDSLGLFQMRPSTGWGSVAELMEPGYQARAFFGGPDGPNHGSPRGLLDIPNWQTLPKGAAAQAVEVSAYPDRYQAYEPVAEAILTALTADKRADSAEQDPSTNNKIQPSQGRAEVNTQPVAATPGNIVFPLPEGTWTWTSGFGYRVHPLYGTRRLHAGVDYAAPAGTPVLSVADGVVAHAGPDPRAGNLLILDHVVDGQRVATAYAHLLDGSTLVSDGDPVIAGQQVAAVGTTGDSTAPHLHLELHPGGFNAPAVDPEPWLDAQAPDVLTTGHTAPPACTAGGSE